MFWNKKPEGEGGGQADEFLKFLDEQIKGAMPDMEAAMKQAQDQARTCAIQAMAMDIFKIAVASEVRDCAKRGERVPSKFLRVAGFNAGEAAIRYAGGNTPSAVNEGQLNVDFDKTISEVGRK